ncbi:hypothetical protein D5S18_21290 [Nocardia panacis]|uniref:Uncharacterized protein n=1 Tax=Nocardia panacis TaxID=2340916 RepID=A0A3A4KHF8_9NOCA|nr:hypothetical protein [Nocardia panacis]RJO73708.1 hypothetical protein D5S18_21290 [Nocardia panacis]
MGLAIAIGDDDYQEELDELAMLLKEEGIVWQQPESCVLPPGRATMTSVPYSALYCLHRVYARCKAELPVTPVSDMAEVEADHEVIADERSMCESHLLCHSDVDGYYIPVDFDAPEVVGDDYERVGSSQGLLAELQYCAAAIGIRLEPDLSLSDNEAQRIDELIRADSGEFTYEWMAWLALHEACRQSIDSGHAIVFIG